MNHHLQKGKHCPRRAVSSQKTWCRSLLLEVETRLRLPMLILGLRERGACGLVPRDPGAASALGEGAFHGRVCGHVVTNVITECFPPVDVSVASTPPSFFSH